MYDVNDHEMHIHTTTTRKIQLIFHRFFYMNIIPFIFIVEKKIEATIRREYMKKIYLHMLKLFFDIYVIIIIELNIKKNLSLNGILGEEGKIL